MSITSRTLLKVLVEQRHWRYVDFERHFCRSAAHVLDQDARNLSISESQFRRWTSGKVRTLPGPDTCRVLEYLFGVDAAQLFGPAPSPHTPAPAFSLEDEIAMTARDAQNEAGAAAAASISDTTIDQLRDDVVSLARKYTTTAAFDAFRKARELREQAEHERDRTQVPAQQQELLITAGQACALLATAAFDLGSLDGATRLSRSAALYGETARFNPLRAFAGGTLAYIAYFSGQPLRAAQLARQAQTFAGLGDVARRRLASIEARAYGHLGDIAATQRALDHAQRVEADATDALHDEVGGEFGFDDARLAMSNGTTCLLLGDGPQAEAAAHRALELIAAKPAAERSQTITGRAAADLSMARLLRGDLDGANAALEPVWAVPRGQRVTGLRTRMSHVRETLTGERFRTVRLAQELGERIEDFSRSSAAHELGIGGPLTALEG
ncbi:DNA-binding protein [Streptomyces noursei]|uniref:DNA-binding protein n=1 Tax=Streptomyces noursei TaxID=1971 RepID=UPI00382013A2